MGWANFRLALVVFSVGLLGAMCLAPAAGADSQYVTTQTGKVRCAIDSSFPGSPPGGKVNIPPGSVVMCAPYAPQGERPGWVGLAVVTSSGNFSFYPIELGIRQPNDLVMSYGQTYHFNGWTIAASQDGTRFTNDGTGRGMFVNFETAYAF
jgi:hypothetical protein